MRLLFLLAIALPVAGQPALSDGARAYLVTMTPGDALYSAWGHTGIRIQDEIAGIDVVYNFGTFDFRTPNFYTKFVRGQLDYELSRAAYARVVRAYAYEERGLSLQRLNLSPTQVQQLFTLLEVNFQPENRAYRYSFLFDNCATRPRDAIEAVTGDTLQTEDTPPTSFRSLLHQYLDPYPWAAFGIDLALGRPVDRIATPRERLFLPYELRDAVASARLPNQPLAEPEQVVIPPPEPEEAGFVPTPLLAWTLLLAAGIAFAFFAGPRLNLAFDAVLFTLAGFGGLLLLFLWFGTEHGVTEQNWNAIWLLPAHLIALPLTSGSRKDAAGSRVYWMLSAGLAGLAVLWALSGWGPQVLPMSGAPLMMLLAFRSGRRAAVQSEPVSAPETT